MMLTKRTILNRAEMDFGNGHCFIRLRKELLSEDGTVAAFSYHRIAFSRDVDADSCLEVVNTQLETQLEYPRLTPEDGDRVKTVLTAVRSVASA